MSERLIDLIPEADLLEVDGYSIRYFGLDEDEMGTGRQDAVVLSLTVDDEWQTFEWAFTREELSAARYDAAQEGWWVRNGQSESLVRLYRLQSMTPEQSRSAVASEPETVG